MAGQMVSVNLMITLVPNFSAMNSQLCEQWPHLAERHATFWWTLVDLLKLHPDQGAGHGHTKEQNDPSLLFFREWTVLSPTGATSLFLRTVNHIYLNKNYYSTNQSKKCMQVGKMETYKVSIPTRTRTMDES